MSRISNSVVTPPEFKSLNLEPIMGQHFNSDAQDILKNHRTTSTIVQWDRKVGNNKFEGVEARNLGELLGKLKILHNEDLFASNYVREFTQVRYYGHTTTPDRLADAALIMVGMINDLATKKLIRAVLAPLIALELVGGKTVIVSYIAVDQPNEVLVQSMYGALEFKEGALPPELK